MTTETRKHEVPSERGLTGTVIRGSGRATFFTALDWVKSQCTQQLGFEPYPGTLNLIVEHPDYHHYFPEIEQIHGLPLLPPDETFCESSLIPIRANGIPAAIILPEERVRMHGSSVIEILAPVCLRETLSLADGDRIRIELAKDLKSCARAVLFDLDGTLIDSVGIYFKIVEIVMATLGLSQPSREEVLQAAEKDPFDWLELFPPDQHYRKEHLLLSAQRIVETTYPRLFREKAVLMSGTLDILTRLAGKGIKIGIVTSTPRKHIEHKMRLFDENGVSHLLTTVITADDAPRKKPAPDPLIRCAELLATPLSECIYVGDTCSDIRAGKAAGMKTVAVSTGFDRPTTLAEEKPDILIDSINMLSKIFFWD